MMLKILFEILDDPFKVYAVSIILVCCIHTYYLCKKN